MKVVALISGGKDSCYNMMHCVLQGHEIVALANLMPEVKDELDSYMFQTVGHDVIQLYSEALGIPLFRRIIKGTSLCVESNYEISKGDEVEDLYELLKEIQESVDYDAVSSGAILSNYQRVRVENICRRLSLQSLAYLWERNQEELLNEMIKSKLTAILIKVATLGLDQKHLGKTLQEMQPHLMKMKDKYGINVCGEGGEYETITLDCPLFLKKIVIDKSELVMHSNDAFAPVGYLTFKELHLQDKNMNPNSTLSERLADCVITVPPLFGETQFLTNQDDLGKDITTDNFSLMFDPNAYPKEETEKIHFNQNKHGRAWISNIVCLRDDSIIIEESTVKTLDKWKGVITNNGYTMTDVCLVHLFCSSMDDFTKINGVYKKYFPLNPPARVCLEASLPSTHHFRLDSCLNDCSKNRRIALHVESISYWAPANIGPYSQAVKVHSSPKSVYFSGSIAMQPSSMKVINEGIQSETILSLKHVNEVSKTIAADVHSEQAYGCINCYVTRKSYIPSIQNWYVNIQNYFNANRYLLNIVCVSRLPRDAKVEWHVVSRVAENKTEIGDSDDDDYDYEFCDEQNSANQCVEEVIHHNHGFLKLVICMSDISTGQPFYGILSSKLKQMLKAVEVSFVRCFYLHSIVEDEMLLRKTFDSCLDSLNHALNVSYIPVTGLPSDCLISLVGET